MSIKRVVLKKKAKQNTNVVLKQAHGKETTMTSGNPLDCVVKNDPVPRIGMSLGITKNMDNYESLRVDAWLTDDLQENENLAEKYKQIHSVLDEVINEAVAEYCE